MGIAERKDRETKQMRERILAAAMALFSKGGADKVTMRAIARKIEYSPGAIYLYFRNKDELLREMCFQGFEKLVEVLRKVEDNGDPMQRLRAACRGYIGFARENPNHYELMLSTKGIRRVTPAENNPALISFDLWRGLVRACIASGSLSGLDEEVVSYSLWSSLHGMSMLLIKEQIQRIPPDRLDAVVDGMLSFLLRP